MLAEPTIDDVLAARERIAPHLSRTPLRSYPALSNHVGVDVVAASTGNHGQSVALAARVHGVRAVICMPERPNPAKLEGIRSLGAEVVLVGADFDEAREQCEALANQHGYRYVHSGDEPLLIAGVATAQLEIHEDDPEIDTVIVPVGGGSGAAAACIVAESLAPELRVIGVRSSGAPAAYASWRVGRPVAAACTTTAEGLATRAAVLELAETPRGRRVALIASGGNSTLSQLGSLLA